MHLPQHQLEYSTVYDPETALDFFQHFGNIETVKTGDMIFEQGQKANRLLLQNNKMYLVMAGKINIQIAAKVVAQILPGQIFGELTPLILSVRTATAIADMPSRIISLTEKQLLAGLKKKPEFALMLMNVLVRYLRQALAEKRDKHTSVERKASENTVFDAKILGELVEKLGYSSVINMSKQQTIFQEGDVGMFLYIILSGYVNVKIGDKIVERTGVGGIFGEIALIDQQRRTASVVTATACSLLAVNRQTFLNLIQTQPVFGISLLRALATRLHTTRTEQTHSFSPAHSLFSHF